MQSCMPLLGTGYWSDDLTADAPTAAETQKVQRVQPASWKFHSQKKEGFQV